MTYHIFGIDPGINGAIGVIDSDKGKFVSVGNFVKDPSGTKIYSPALYNRIGSEFIDIRSKFVVEQVHSKIGNAMASVFNFGVTYGRILGICDLFARESVIFVTPQKWKKHFGVLKTKQQTVAESKEMCRHKALEIFPEAADMLKRKKDHDRAEALLIARYAFENKL